MRLMYFFPFTIAAILASPAPLDLVNSNHISSNGHLQLNPIPNPCPVPHTPYEIDFFPPDIVQHSPVSRYDIEGCINLAVRNITQHLHASGDGIITNDHYYDYGQVRFNIWWDIGVHGPSEFTFHDALQVVQLFAVKMGREGYRARSGALSREDLEEAAGQATLCDVGDEPWDD